MQEVVTEVLGILYVAPVTEGVLAVMHLINIQRPQRWPRESSASSDSLRAARKGQTRRGENDVDAMRDIYQDQDP